MEVTFVTTNAGKAASLAAACEAYGIRVRHVKRELPEPQIPDLRAVARHKAESAYALLKAPLLVADSGFFLDAWQGFPGIMAKYAVETLGLDGFSQLLAGRSRSCSFENCYAYMKGPGDIVFFEDSHQGQLIEKPRGTLGAGAWGPLWLAFVPDGSEKTLAEMSREELERDRAGRKSAAVSFAEWFAQGTRA